MEYDIGWLVLLLVAGVAVGGYFGWPVFDRFFLTSTKLQFLTAVLKVFCISTVVFIGLYFLGGKQPPSEVLLLFWGLLVLMVMLKLGRKEDPPSPESPPPSPPPQKSTEEKVAELFKNDKQ